MLFFGICQHYVADQHSTLQYGTIPSLYLTVQLGTIPSHSLSIHPYAIPSPLASPRVLAIPMPYLTILSYSFAYPRVTTRHITIPLRRPSLLFCTVAGQGCTSPFLSSSSPRLTTPPLYFTTPYIPVAVHRVTCHYFTLAEP